MTTPAPERRDDTERISLIERQHLKLQGDVGEITRDIGALVESNKTLTTTVQQIALNQQAGAKTNWSVILASLTAFVMVMGLIVYEPLHSLWKEFRAHIGDGHPSSVLSMLEQEHLQSVGDHQRYDKSFDRIEVRLDEMALTDKAATERLFGIERDLYPGAQYRAGRPTGRLPMITVPAQD